MAKLKSFKKLFKKIIQSNGFTKFISNLIYYYALLVGKTTSWQVRGVKEFYQCWDKEQSIILIGWHGRAMMLPYFWNKKHPLNALVSLHHDGRLIAGFLEKFGLGTIGGSSSNNALGSARDLMHSLQDGISISIIPDGPKGPNMKLGKSPIYYAQKTGKPIFAATYSIAKSKIAHKSWDKMMLPVPFSKGIYEIIGPYYIDEKATEDQLQAWQTKIENDLNNATHNMDQEMGIEKILPGGIAKKKKYSNHSKVS